MKHVLVVTALLLGGVAHAESFELATYTPPAGWTAVNGGYQRVGDANGVGQIRLIAGHAASKKTAAEEFAVMWRARVVPDLKGASSSTAAPKPELEIDGDVTIAVGGTAVTVQNVQFNVVLATVVGRGRVFGISSLSAGDTAVAEVIAFFDTVKFGKASSAPASSASPASPATTTTPSPTTTSGKSELEFKAPPGYTISRESTIVLKPTKKDQPCIYGIGPSRAASGSLETDAKAALAELLGDYRVKWQDHFQFRRGIAVSGWSFYWYRTVVQRTVGQQIEEANAMTMAVSGTKGQTHIVYGIGNASCLLDDLAFAQLFHSLRVPGVADGAKQIAKELAGNTWRMTAGGGGGPSGMMQYTFAANGRYWYGYGTRTQMGFTETTTASSGDGNWAIKDSHLVLTPDRKGAAQKIQIRLYDWPIGGDTVRALGWLVVGGRSELEFFRVDDSK